MGAAEELAALRREVAELKCPLSGGEVQRQELRRRFDKLAEEKAALTADCDRMACDVDKILTKKGEVSPTIR